MHLLKNGNISLDALEIATPSQQIIRTKEGNPLTIFTAQNSGVTILDELEIENLSQQIICSKD